MAPANASRSKRPLAPNTLSTPPTSPTPIKKIRLTYTSTNEALKALNKEKEEATLSCALEQATSPELIEIPPRGKGWYKLQWGGKDKEFMLVGTVFDHDVMVKKEVLARPRCTYIDE